MRPLPLLVAALVLVAPLVAALPPLTSPQAHATPDLTAYRAQVDRAVGFVLSHQKPDGGIYEHPLVATSLDASKALALLGRDPQTPKDGAAFSALVGWWKGRQAVDGSFGGGCCAPTYTSTVLKGLLDAGYDPNSTMVQRALAYVRLTQGPDGGWSDGGARSAHQTAWNVEILLRAGTPRDDVRIQQAILFILTTRHADSGGFGPTPGWFETEAVTADVIGAFDAYLRSPAGANEIVPASEVQSAVDGALSFLASRVHPTTGYWQHNVGANAGIVGPVGRYYAARGLDEPAWLMRGVQALLDHQAANGGLTNNQGSTTILDWTAEAFAGLLEFPRALGASDSVAVQGTVNVDGAYQAVTVTLTLRDASGNVVASHSGPAGLASFSWSGLAPGRYVLRAESAGAAPHETAFWR